MYLWMGEYQLLYTIYIYILAVGKYQKMNKMHLVSVSSLERQRMEYQWYWKHAELTVIIHITD